MEDGKLPLEESLAAYQRGTELLKFCESKLTDAQARIAVLEGESLRDFNPDAK
jgi:exodeoxyribonuclease VII small subunit